MLSLETRAVRLSKKVFPLENRYALLREEITSFTEASISSHQQTLSKRNANSKIAEKVEPHTLKKISIRLEEAEELSNKKKINNSLERIRRANLEISEEISKALPNSLILKTIKSICKKRSLAFSKREQSQIDHIRKTSTIAYTTLVIGAICLVLSGVASLTPYFITATSMIIIGIITEIIGLVFMKENLLSRKLLSQTMQSQEMFIKLQMSITLIEKIADDGKKKAALTELLNIILNIK